MRNLLQAGVALFVLVFSLATPARAQEFSVEDLFAGIDVQMRRGNHTEALALADQIIAREPKRARGYFAKGRIHETAGHLEKAIIHYTEALQVQTNLAQIYERRGLARFQLGRFAEALSDFDRQIQLEPKVVLQHWQRGITYYELGRWLDARNQFELHQRVNPEDVENAAWHFASVARMDGAAKARELLMPVKKDARVPMMEIHALYAGAGSVDAVLAAVEQGKPSDSERKRRAFYAHLYIALYHEAHGEFDKTATFLKAAVELAPPDIMGTVARNHRIRSQRGVTSSTEIQ